jgi:hypothetical protein
MDSFMKALVNGTPVSKEDTESFFYNICDREHSTCNSDCPVFAITNSVPNKSNSRYGCDCFKDGKAMIKYLKTNS